jgi:phosphopantetheinyl transferase (holo-ACP synthase)
MTERRDYSEISTDIKQFVHEELAAGFAAHEAQEKEWFQAILRAFPNEDIEGHHDYHNLKIKAAKAEEEFWHTAKAVAVQQGVAGIFTVLRWVAVLSLLGLAYKFGFGPVAAKLFGVVP